MSYKWWYGLSPEGIQNTLNREIQIRDDRIAELEHNLNQERKAYEKDIYVWQDNYASLEAKLGKVMGELKSLTDVSSYMQSSASRNKHRHDNSVTDTIWSQWSKQIRSSRRVLVEIKGDK